MTFKKYIINLYYMEINFTTNDVKAVVDYIKSIIATKGANYNITENDLYGLPLYQTYAIDRFRQRYGPTYLYRINDIMGQYIIFKGGANSEKQWHHELTKHGERFVRGLLGQKTTSKETGEQHLSNIAGTIAGTAAGSVLGYVTAKSEPTETEKAIVEVEQQMSNILKDKEKICKYCYENRKLLNENTDSENIIKTGLSCILCDRQK